MSKRRWVCAAAALAALGLAASGAYGSAHGQGAARKFRPGQVIETGGGVTEQIIQCRGAGSSEECETQAYRGGEPVGTRSWSYASSLRAAVERVEAASGPQPAAAPRSTPAPTRPPRAVAQCSFAPPAPGYSQSDRFSANLAKRNIYDGYARAANGTSSAPLRVGVSFVSFTLGTPFTNRVRNVPGRGAQRINDAAPPNVTIYRVRSRHVVCEEYSDGVQRREVTGDYDCFKNRDGEWVCGSGGSVPPRIIQLDRG